VRLFFYSATLRRKRRRRRSGVQKVQGGPGFRLLLPVAQTVQVLPDRIAVYRRRQVTEPGAVHRGRIPGRRAAAAEDGVRREGVRRRPRRADRQSASAGGLFGRGAGPGPAQSRVAVPRPLAVDDIRQTATGRVQRTGIRRVAGGPGRTRLLRAPHDHVPEHTAAGQGTGVRHRLAVFRRPVRRHGVPARVLGVLQLPGDRFRLFRGQRTSLVALHYKSE